MDLNIRKNLKLIHGSFDEEIVEQTLSCKYISENDVVLEIGGNMGRNAIVISSILNNQNNLVTMEPNNEFHIKLTENRDFNSKKFNIENSALSINPLYFHGSHTIYQDKIEETYPLSGKHLINNNNNLQSCNITDFSKLENKYNLSFNVLVIDCEGAFYFILKDMPYILDKIKLIIIENDFENIEHYYYIKKEFENNKFLCVESIELKNCPWDAPCKNNFYEVWKK